MRPARPWIAAALLAAAAGGASAQEVKQKPGVPATPDVYKEKFKDVLTVAARGGTSSVAGVEVTSESYEKVEWKAKSGPSGNRPAAEVLSIAYGDVPANFTRGMEAWKAARWPEAAEEFKGVANAVTNKVCRPFWEARGLAYLGDSLRRQAAKEKNPAQALAAAKTLESALQKDPKSPILDLVCLGLAEAKAGGEDWDGAFKALDEFAKTAQAAGRISWEASARLTRGRLLERRGDVGAAATEFEELARLAQSKSSSFPPDSPDRRLLDQLRVNGLVNKGWALFARAEKTKSPGDMDAARTFFDALPREAGGSAAARAAGLNGSGAVLLSQGKAREALERFVEVEVTMFAVPEEVARAIWYKAEAQKALGNAAGRDAALKDLVEYYGWSEWAERAR